MFLRDFGGRLNKVPAILKHTHLWGPHVQTTSGDARLHQPGRQRPAPLFTANSRAGSLDLGAPARGQPGSRWMQRWTDSLPSISDPFRISLKASWAAVPRTKLNSLAWVLPTRRPWLLRQLSQDGLVPMVRADPAVLTFLMSDAPYCK